MSQECSKCGSTRIIPNVRIQDQGQGSNGQLTVGIAEVPQAIFFQRLQFSRLNANICGDCGFTELFADKPQLLYAAYLKSQES